MLNKNTLLLLTAACLLVVVAIITTKPAPLSGTVARERFFPDLMEQLNDVAKITVASKSMQFDIEQQQGQWVLPQQANYPVAIDKVKEMLFGLAELIRIEPKTANPDYYAKVNLQDLAADNSQAVQVTLTSKQGDLIAALLVGKSKMAKANPDLREYFVRKPDSKQSWEVVGALPELSQSTAWLDNNIVNIAEAEIKEVVLHEQQQPLKLMKIAKGDPQFIVADMPKDHSIDSPYSVNYIAHTLGSLAFEQAYRIDDLQLVDVTSKAKLVSFDGMVIDYQLFTLEQKTVVKLAARVAAEVTDELSKEMLQQREQRVVALQQRFATWVYAIPDYQAVSFTKKLSDLVSEAK